MTVQLCVNLYTHRLYICCILELHAITLIQEFSAHFNIHSVHLKAERVPGARHMLDVKQHVLLRTFRTRRLKIKHVYTETVAWLNR